MIDIRNDLKPEELKSRLEHFWALSGEKIRLIEREYDPAQGSPVYTVAGKYTTRGWTEWTQGFQYGSHVEGIYANGWGHGCRP